MGATYRSTEGILQWLKEAVQANSHQWNSTMMLVHAGTNPRRKDKLYHRLAEIIQYLRQKGFLFRRIDDLIQ
jgi:endoglucanase